MVTTCTSRAYGNIQVERSKDVIIQVIGLLIRYNREQGNIKRPRTSSALHIRRRNKKEQRQPLRRRPFPKSRKIISQILAIIHISEQKTIETCNFKAFLCRKSNLFSSAKRQNLFFVFFTFTLTLQVCKK